jgi:hypothetical protein
MSKDNKKLPETRLDRKELKAKHPYTTGYSGFLGDSEYTYASPKEPDNYFVQKTRASGSYETIDYDSSKSEIITQFNPGENRGYCAGGNSKQVDGNDDLNIESTSRTNVYGDRGVSCKTSYQVSTEGSVISHNRFKKEFVVAASDSKSFTGSYGDQVNEHSGNWHEAFEKDHVEAVKGNKITMIENGEYAMHVQSGNFDTFVNQQARLYAEKDITIESATKITLKVGGSTIEITSGGIKMIAPRIDLN